MQVGPMAASAQDSRQQSDIAALSRRLCDQIVALNISDIPSDVVEHATLLLLDTIGVMAASSRLDEMRSLVARLAAWEPNGSSRVIVGGCRVSPPTAALIHGTAAHALEFDDIHDETRVHASSVVLPALLASLEGKPGITAAEIVTAYILGVEVSCRLGLACFRTVDHGWHPTASLCTFGAAAAVGKVLGLDSARMQHALGIAFVQLAGTLQSNHDQAFTKRLGPGLAARAGVLAAHLAADGVTGPVRFLEGDAGLFAVQERGEFRADALLDDLGQRWRISEVGPKLYPSCRCAHTAIDIGRELHREGLRGKSVARATIGLGKTNHQIIGARFNPPSPSGQHAQFNGAYNFVRAIEDGNVGLDSFEEAKVHDVRIGEIARRVEVICDPDIEPSAVGPAKIELVLANGATITRRRNAAGQATGAALHDAVVAKFKSNLKFGNGASEESARTLAEDFLSISGKSGPGRFLSGLSRLAARCRFDETSSRPS
jgi:2-methylcitrate dehydratase PrpD